MPSRNVFSPRSVWRFGLAGAFPQGRGRMTTLLTEDASQRQPFWNSPRPRPGDRTGPLAGMQLSRGSRRPCLLPDHESRMQQHHALVSPLSRPERAGIGCHEHDLILPYQLRNAARGGLLKSCSTPMFSCLPSSASVVGLVSAYLNQLLTVSDVSRRCSVRFKAAAGPHQTQRPPCGPISPSRSL